MEYVYSVLLVVLGASVTIATPEYCPSTADIIFVLDRSGSIGNSNFPTMQEFAVDVVDQFGEGDDARFGFITFASDVTDHFKLNTFSTKSDTIREIRSLSIRVGGGTATYYALRKVQDLFTPHYGDRPGHRNIVIVITDGYSNSYSLTVNEANYLKAAGIEMISIGVGSHVNHLELQAMSSDPTAMLTVQTFEGLAALLTQLCPIVVADPCTSSACVNGACVENGTDYVCNCTVGWAGRYCAERARYDCYSNNPCDPPIIAVTYHYPAFSDVHFIQCSEWWWIWWWPSCYEMPCASDTVWDQDVPGCKHAATGQDCGARNPCGKNDSMYFTHSDRAKFIQCDAFEGCFEMPCAPGTVFDARTSKCNHTWAVP